MVLTIVLAGCSLVSTPRSTYMSTAGSAACAAPRASFSPTPAVAGHEVTVRVTDAAETCHDQGEGPNVPLESVVVRLVDPVAEAVVAQVVVPIADDFTGEATLPLAGVEPGTYQIWVDDYEDEDLEVIAP